MPSEIWNILVFDDGAKEQDVSDNVEIRYDGQYGCVHTSILFATHKNLFSICIHRRLLSLF